ncbi:MAG: hypothetical protein IAF02_11260 [Anaerolineae bacterium]|nr:hypothetical protein [Anaerolineae bacterium]
MIVTPISFGALTLHNSTSHFSAKTIIVPYKAKIQLIELPGGVLFDTALGGDGPILPGHLTASVVISSPSTAALSTEIDTIFTFFGKLETLSVRKLDSTIITCDARIETIELVHPFKIVTGTKTKVNLNFQCITLFS